MTVTQCLYNNIFYLSSDDPNYIKEDGHSGYAALEFWHGDNTPMVVQRHWENTHKIFESPDKVSFGLDDYPNGLPFRAGAIREGDGKFMMNYNRDKDRQAFTLANHGLNWGSYLTDDGLIMLPNQSSTVRVDNVTMGQNGTKVDVYYSGDIYTKDISNLLLHLNHIYFRFLLLAMVLMLKM